MRFDTEKTMNLSGQEEEAGMEDKEEATRQGGGREEKKERKGGSEEKTREGMYIWSRLRERSSNCKSVCCSCWRRERT